MPDSELEPPVPEHRPDDAPTNIAALNGDADVPQLEPELEPEIAEDVAQTNGDDASAQTPEITRGPRELLEEGSELGSVDVDSVDGLPKRVGSPIDSVTSGQNVSPSIQVRLVPSLPPHPKKLTGCRIL